MSRRPGVQLLLRIVVGWFITQAMLKFFTPIPTVIIVSLVALVTVTIYGLRFERRRLGKLYQKPLLKRFIDLVCSLSRQQPPVDSVSCAGSQALRLKTAEDFAWLCGKLKSEVFGHGRAIDAISAHLQKTIEVRRRSEPRAGLPPLGAFLLLGSPGIGKRWIAQKLAARMYEKPLVAVFDLADYSDNDAVVRLFGASGREGTLVTAVKRRPYQVLVLENVERAHARVQQQLQTVLMQGVCPDPVQGGTVSFQNCVIFLASTVPLVGLPETDPLPHEAIIAALQSEAGCSAALLRLCNHLAVLKTPDPLTQAKVVLQLMIDECRKYQLELDYVEPEIVSDQLVHFSESAGFENCKVQLAHLMGAPIHLAVSNGMDNLVLTRDMIQVCPTSPQADAPPEFEMVPTTRSAL